MTMPTPPAARVLQFHLVRGTLTEGESFPLAPLISWTGTGNDRAGVEWRSSDSAVVGVDAEGRITAESLGAADVHVTDGVHEAHARIDVTRIAVFRLSLDPVPNRISVGDQLTLVARPVDSINAALTRRLIEWQALTPDIATISATGVVRAVAAGQAAFSALCGGEEAKVAITIEMPRITGVLIQPRALRLLPGEFANLSAQALTVRGKTMPADRVTWTSSNEAVVQVGTTGRVFAVREGIARIHGTLGECKGIVPVEVRNVDDQ